MTPLSLVENAGRAFLLTHALPGTNQLHLLGFRRNHNGRMWILNSSPVTFPEFNPHILFCTLSLFFFFFFLFFLLFFSVLLLPLFKPLLLFTSSLKWVASANFINGLCNPFTGPLMQILNKTRPNKRFLEYSARYLPQV